MSLRKGFLFVIAGFILGVFATSVYREATISSTKNVLLPTKNNVGFRLTVDNQERSIVISREIGGPDSNGVIETCKYKLQMFGNEPREYLYVARHTYRFSLTRAVDGNVDYAMYNGDVVFDHLRETVRNPMAKRETNLYLDTQFDSMKDAMDVEKIILQARKDGKIHF